MTYSVNKTQFGAHWQTTNVPHLDAAKALQRHLNSYLHHDDPQIAVWYDDSTHVMDVLSEHDQGHIKPLMHYRREHAEFQRTKPAREAALAMVAEKVTAKREELAALEISKAENNRRFLSRFYTEFQSQLNEADAKSALEAELKRRMESVKNHHQQYLDHFETALMAKHVKQMKDPELPEALKHPVQTRSYEDVLKDLNNDVLNPNTGATQRLSHKAQANILLTGLAAVMIAITPVKHLPVQLYDALDNQFGISELWQSIKTKKHTVDGQEITPFTFIAP